MLKAHRIDLRCAKSQICALLYRKLELSSVFGPPEREGLHIPESECSALVMVLWERQILDHMVPSEICLFDLSKQNRSNRSCIETEKGLPPHPGPQTQIAGEKRERKWEKEWPPSLIPHLHLSRFDLSMTVTQFQVSNYPCSLFSTIGPPQRTQYRHTKHKLSWPFQQCILGGSHYENIMTLFWSSCSY